MEDHFADKVNDTPKAEVMDQINGYIHRIHELKSLLSHKEEDIENLKKIESTYHNIIENMEMGYAYYKIIVEDGIPCDFIFLEVNKAFEEIIGLDKEILIGKRITDALPGIKYDLQDWIEIFGKVALDRQLTTLEQYSSVLNKWFSVTVYSPSIEHFATLFYDITKQIEEKQVFKKQIAVAQIRLQRLEKILNATGEGIYSLDIDGKVTYVNPAAAKILGYEIEELKGKEIHSLVHCSNDNEINNESCHACTPHRDGSSHTAIEEVFLKKGGTSIPVDYVSTPLYNENNVINGMVVCFQDVTKRKKTKDESITSETQFNALLAASEARFKNLFGKMEKEIEKGQKFTQIYLDIVDVAILALDSSGRVTLVNRKGCEILGYEEEEIIGKNWFDTFLPEHKRDSERETFETLMNEEIELVEYAENVVITKSGEERIIYWRNMIITDDSKRITGTISSGMDITGLKKSEKALQQSLAGLSSVFHQ